MSEHQTTIAEEIRDAILDDVTDRKGWRHAWDGFDDDIQQEIKDVWLIVINEILEERGVVGSPADEREGRS